MPPFKCTLSAKWRMWSSRDDDITLYRCNTHTVHGLNTLSVTSVHAPVSHDVVRVQKYVAEHPCDYS